MCVDSDDGRDGVKAFTSVDAACAALQSGDIQGFVADVNMLNMCFVIWSQAGTSFSGFVLAELESARLESYVALFHNASKDVFSAVLNAMEPAEVSNSVNVLNNGDASALVAYNWNPAANGIVPPQPGGWVYLPPSLPPPSWRWGCCCRVRVVVGGQRYRAVTTRWVGVSPTHCLRKIIKEGRACKITQREEEEAMC